jgi:pimeloyl-ACP methyl ester carboxylesterase
MATAELNGVRLHVEEKGAGDPLVLVHGSWDDRHVWALVEDGLARRFRVLRYDRCGHTDSEGRAADTRRGDEDDLAALIESLGCGPVDVAANSFGGSIALGLAARRPELFRSLCAHEPPLIGLAVEDPEVAGFTAAMGPVRQLIAAGRHEEAARAFVDGVVPGAWGMLPADQRERLAGNAPTFAAEIDDPAGFDLDLEGLSRVRFPILLTQGDQSPAFFARVIARISAAVPSVEVRTLAGAGHVPHETNADEYVALVEGWVREEAVA